MRDSHKALQLWLCSVTVMVLITCDGCVVILEIRVRYSCLEALICHRPADWLCQRAGTVSFTDLSSGPVFLTALLHVSERVPEVWPDQEILCEWSYIVLCAVHDLCLLFAYFTGK